MTAGAVSDRTASDGMARRPLPGRLGYVLCAAVTVLVLVLDQATKFIAVEALPKGVVVDSGLPWIEWQLVGNPDAAFGIPGFTWMFVAVTVVVLVLVIRALPRTDRLSLTAAYGLVSGGALGNVGDRLFREDGAVVDFIKIGQWPTFNLADTAIVTGAALILVLTLAAEREARRRARATADHQSVRPETLVPPPPPGDATSPGGPGRPGGAPGSPGRRGTPDGPR